MTILVLDFDGTMTDAEAEGRPFRDGYLDDLCALVGRPAYDPEVRAIAEEVEAELMRAPSSHPFLWMGRAVAPATVDPYLRMVPIAHRVLDQFGAMPNAIDRSRLRSMALGIAPNWSRTRCAIGTIRRYGSTVAGATARPIHRNGCEL